MKRSVVLFAGLAFGIGCGDLTAPLPREGAPDELQFSINTVFVGATTWELRGDTLVYGVVEFGVPVTDVRSIPSAEAWREFWLEIERIGVQQWRSRYVAENIADGEGWHTRIRAGNSVIESTGGNAYPDERGREQERIRTAAFEAYIAAFRKLADVEGT